MRIDEIGSSEWDAMLLMELSDLTVRCSAGVTSSRAALAAGISVEALRSFLKLPRSHLLVARDGVRAAGFALFHLQSAELPEPVNWFGGAFGALTSWGYGHLIVVDEPYRGPAFDLYARFMKLSRQRASGSVDWLWALTRHENAARRAHLRAGWIETGVSREIRVHDLSYTAEILVLPAAPQASPRELVRRFTERALELGAPFCVSAGD